MRISFPYMGTVIIYKKILELLGHQVIVPPKPSKRTLDLGVKYSPEFACFPFKAIMGTYVEACELKVDTLVTSGGHGPCRAGFYSEVHKRILKQMGHSVDFIVFDSYFRDKKKFIENIKKIKDKNSWLKVIKAIILTYKMIKALDEIDKEIHRIRAYERVPGKATKIWDQIQSEFDKITTFKDLKKAIIQGNQLMETIETVAIDESQRIRVGIVGEIYVVMEPSINMDIEKVLGELGCEVERAHYLSDWVNHNMLPNRFKHSNEEEIRKKGSQYIEIEIGGHAQESIGKMIDFADHGFDAIVHLMPFGCLPELISQSIIPKISKQYDIPILSLSLDEQTGQANNRTRIEAFVDLIKNKKRAYQSNLNQVI